MIKVDLPDGGTAEYPDGTDPAIIERTLQETFGKSKQPPAVSKPSGESLLTRAASNFFPSLGKDVIAPIFNPETYKGLAELGSNLSPQGWATNILEKGQMPWESALKGAEMLYGAGKGMVAPYADEGGLSWEKTKETFAEHPAQVFTDLAGLLIPAGKLSGVKGLSRAAEFIDPISLGMKGIEKGVGAVGTVAKWPVSVTSGVGVAPLEEAVKSSPEFKAAIRGKVSAQEIVEDAKKAPPLMQAKAGREFKQGKQQVLAQPNIPQMDIMPVMQEFTDILHEADIDLIRNPQTGKVTGLNFDKSKYKFNQPAQNDFNRLMESVKGAFNDPSMRTAKGFDTLKQQIWSLQKETNMADWAVERMFGNVRSQLGAKVPGYDQVMANYEKAENAIKEVTKTLSLKEGGTADTAIRKLNLAMREDDDLRRGLIQKVEEATGKDISALISGRLMETWTPKTWMGREIAAGSIFGSLFASKPAILLTLGTASPRLVGETLMLLGKGGKAYKAVEKSGVVGKEARQIPYQYSKSRMEE